MTVSQNKYILEKNIYFRKKIYYKLYAREKPK